MAAYNGPVSFPDFDHNLAGFVDVQHGDYVQVGYPLPPDSRFMAPNMHQAINNFSPAMYVSTPDSHMPYHPGHFDPHSIPAPGFYSGDTRVPQRPRSGSFNQRGPRLSFSQAQNSPRMVDPHSFSRFSGERFSQQRPYNSRGGRRTSFNNHVRARRQTMRPEPWQGQRDNGPFDDSQRRVFSDQRPDFSTPAPQGSQENRDFRSQSDVVAERGYPLAQNNEQPQPFFHQATIPGVDAKWICTSNHIGDYREDVTSLIVGDLPAGITGRELEPYLQRTVNCEYVTMLPSHAGAMAFVK
jgi:hypothetical protein